MTLLAIWREIPPQRHRDLGIVAVKKPLWFAVYDAVIKQTRRKTQAGKQRREGDGIDEKGSRKATKSAGNKKNISNATVQNRQNGTNKTMKAGRQGEPRKYVEPASTQRTRSHSALVLFPSLVRRGLANASIALLVRNIGLTALAPRNSSARRTQGGSLLVGNSLC